MKSYLLVILFILNCQTFSKIEQSIEKPKDYETVIQETEKKIETLEKEQSVKNSPEAQKAINSLKSQIYKLTISLKDSQNYGNNSYQQLLEQREVVKNATQLNSRLTEENKQKDKEIEKLNSDFFSPTQRRYMLYTMIGIILFTGLYIAFMFWIKGIKIGTSVVTKGAI